MIADGRSLRMAGLARHAGARSDDVRRQDATGEDTARALDRDAPCAGLR